MYFGYLILCFGYFSIVFCVYIMFVGMDFFVDYNIIIRYKYVAYKRNIS